MRTVLLACAALALLQGCGSAQAQPDAFTRLRHMADRGSAEALYHVGMMYQTGTGVAEDRARALEAFRKATAMGDPLAA